jgi:hypothetical protein
MKRKKVMCPQLTHPRMMKKMIRTMSDGHGRVSPFWRLMPKRE